MKELLCAGNAIKELMSASQVLASIHAGVQSAGADKCKNFLLSDGGDGFLEVFAQAIPGAERVSVSCTAPLGLAISAEYLYDNSTQTAYIESAACCGLRLVDENRRDVLASGTAGLADLIASAKELGATRIYVGLGGSATCDGAVGFLWRLACIAGQFRPDACEPRVALDLAESASPDIHQIRHWLGDTKIIGCADVNSPLSGPEGAALVFAPQKGATADQASPLDGLLNGWADRVEKNLGQSVRNLPGAGAAGGLGFGVLALGGTIVPGGREVARIVGLENAVAPGCLLLTTEGKFDETSLTGKAPWTAAQLAVKAGGHAVIFCGIAEENALEIARQNGVTVIEFGRDLPEDRRQEETPGRLQQAVAAYLESERAPA